MAVGAPGAGEVRIELQAMADVADDDEGRRRMIRIEQEDVSFRLLARVLHHHVPAARDAAAAESRRAPRQAAGAVPGMAFFLARQARLLGLQDEGVLLVEVDALGRCRRIAVARAHGALEHVVVQLALLRRPAQGAARR